MLPEYFAYIAVATGLYGGFSYLRGMIRGEIKPNRVTWILWGVAPIIGSYIGYKSGISFPILAATFMAGFVSVPVVIASFFMKDAYWKTTSFDIGCGLLSAIAIIIWVTTKNGVLSLTFAILADLFAGIPTIIKSWRYNDTENVAPYGFGIFNQIITFLIIKNFSFLNFAFPVYLIIANTIIILGIKRKYLSRFLKVSK